MRLRLALQMIWRVLGVKWWIKSQVNVYGTWRGGLVPDWTFIENLNNGGGNGLIKPGTDKEWLSSFGPDLNKNSLIIKLKQLQEKPIQFLENTTDIELYPA